MSGVVIFFNIQTNLGREATTMLASDQVYTKVINKVIEDAQRKENTHTVLEIDRRDTRFLVHETKNPREVRFAGDFTVRLDEREEEEEIQRMSESSTLKIRKFSLTLSTLLKYT
ncbi:hypothetical protein JHK87_031217 [Glycine soja]|nr:hypothetical protein JHK87_031217 [Glycine soja]